MQAALQRPSMDVLERQLLRRGVERCRHRGVSTAHGGRGSPSPAFVLLAGLKPIADDIRRMSLFGSPMGGRAARLNEAKRRRRRVVQVDPSHGGTDARVPRRGRWGDRLSAPDSRVHGRPGIAGVHPAAGRASRGPVNGFAGALAGVLRHRNGGDRRRHPGTTTTGLSDACLGGEPAYPPWPRFARPRRELAGGCAPSDPPIANGAS